MHHHYFYLIMWPMIYNVTFLLHLIRYSHLPEEIYVLTVIASDNYGVW